VACAGEIEHGYGSEIHSMREGNRGSSGSRWNVILTAGLFSI
jgi:hypothetical protein